MLDFTKNPGRPLVASFILGIITATGLHSLFQDWMGKERYIQYLQDHWIAFPWQVDALVVVWALWALNRLGDKVLHKHVEDRVADALSRFPPNIPGDQDEKD